MAKPSALGTAVEGLKGKSKPTNNGGSDPLKFLGTYVPRALANTLKALAADEDISLQDYLIRLYLAEVKKKGKNVEGLV